VQVDFDISKVPSLRYRSGDILEILPLNRVEEVDWLLDVNDLREMHDHLISFMKKKTCGQLTVKKPFPTPTNMKRAISSFLDLHGCPSWGLMRDLAIITGKSASDAENFANEMKNFKSSSGNVLTVSKLLRDCIGATDISKIPFGDLIQILPKQKARAYSIASSPLEDAKKISILISRVDDDALASTYLSDHLRISDLVYVSLRQGSLRLPALPGTPVVMICVGTGVAPFRAFLVELGLKNRAHTGTLFFGCRRETEWICKSTMDAFANNGGTVHVAFSRSNEHKKQYVQDLLEKYSEIVRELVVDKRAIVYVCGSTKMGLSVMDVFNNNICSVDDLRSQKRYFEELWG
jgi:sulfite reductase alpha subunit-like flavoprotein